MNIIKNVKNIKTYLIFLAVLMTATFFFMKPVFGQSQNPQTGSAGLSGTVPANPPTVGAIISFPVNNEVFTAVPITTTGICPADLLVKMFKNQVFAGSVICQVNGTFTIDIDLFSGRNEIVARVFDALEQPGPDSNLVIINYDDTAQNNGADKLLLTSGFATRGANPRETLVWPLGLSGGIGPYAISVDWGDGTTEVISLDFVGNFNLKHIYEQPGTYKTIVKAADSTGDTAFLQLVSIGNGLLQGKLDDGTGSNQVITRKIFVIWPLYVMVGFVIGTFWLGRRYELHRIRKRLENNQQVF